VTIWRVLWPKTDRYATRSEDNVVQLVDYALGTLQTLLNVLLYAWQFHLFKRDGKPWPYFNYIYGVEWLVVILILYATTPPHWLIAILALWRAVEILTWYVKLLFDKGHRVLLEVERNLLFLIIDLMMFVTLIALLLDAEGSPVLSVQKWAAAFSAFTLNGSPAGYDWGRTVGVLGAIGGLTLIGAGLGMLVGLVGQRIRYGPGSEYTGPTRPPAPWEP
jgi:hypothetical protein